MYANIHIHMFCELLIKNAFTLIIRQPRYSMIFMLLFCISKQIEQLTFDIIIIFSREKSIPLSLYAFEPPSTY